jgi:hypothetical protein
MPMLLPERLAGYGVTLRRWQPGDAEPERLGYELVGEAPDERAAPAEMGIDCTWRMERAVWRQAS